MPSAKHPLPDGSNPQFDAQVEAYAQSGFGRDLLPIIPFDAKISTRSRNPDHILGSRGKIPGKKLDDGWVGYFGWTELHSTPGVRASWRGWECSLGLQGRNFPGLDIDIDVLEVADAAEALALEILGRAPVRSAGSPRRLMVYAGQGHPKRRLTFKLPGIEKAMAVELLGSGQQYLVEGIHKSGHAYEWRGEISPSNLGTTAIIPINATKLDEYFDRFAALIQDKFQAELVSTRKKSKAGTVEEEKPDAEMTLTGSRNRRGHRGQKSITLAPSMEALAAAVYKIPNSNGQLSYDDWIDVGLATHAASGGSEEGYKIFEQWSLQYPGNTPRLVRDKWDSFHPNRTGWNWLSQFARQFGFSPAAYEFERIPDDHDGHGTEVGDVAGAGALMFENHVYVEQTKTAVDLKTLEILDQAQFNARHWLIGPPTDPKKCAWAIFLARGELRQTVKSITYRPGAPVLIHEDYEGGECVNIWRPTTTPVPDTATEIEAKPWLDHLKYLIPDERERTLLIHWFAWIIQNPHLKPNWGVLIGSPHQGNGKSILLAPIRAALGIRNVREVTAEDLEGNYSGWLMETKLFVVEEMHSFQRVSAMNRLKGFLASPPYRLRVNPKFGRQFDIANIVAGIFFTNHPNAVALEKSDRRFMIIASEAEPREKAYYQGLCDWYDEGGAALTARYLLDLDLEGFDALGQAPGTQAKIEMRKQSRSRLEEWVEDGMEQGAKYGDGPFGPALIALDDLRRSIPDEVFGNAGRPSSNRFPSTLTRAGAKSLGERINLLKTPPGARPVLGDPKQARLYSLRDHARFASMDRDDLAAAFWEERLRAQGEPLDPDQHFGSR